jgi:hypothetical protein
MGVVGSSRDESGAAISCVFNQCRLRASSVSAEMERKAHGGTIKKHNSANQRDATGGRLAPMNCAKTAPSVDFWRWNGDELSDLVQELL